MKFLKQFKIFEGNEDIISDIYDMCVDLRDRGFETIVTEHETGSVIRIFITKSQNKNYFHFNIDVKDVVLRIYQYMRELGWYSNIKINTRLGGHTTNKKLYIRPDEKIHTEDIVNVDDRWPMIFDLSMVFENY